MIEKQPMTVKKRGLGRGLDALLGGLNKSEEMNAALSTPENTAPQAPVSAPDGEMRRIAVDLLQPGKYQPRHNMHAESLEDLANSIRAQGVVQPIVVRSIGGGRYEIIAGERRWRAAQLAQLHDIPAIIRDVPDNAAIAMALIENIQRENLNSIEEAGALQRLIDEFGMTHHQVATAVGRSRAAVSNLLRLLALNADVRSMVETCELEMGHARALLALQGVPQSEAAKEVVARRMSVRETEKYVKRLQANPTHHAPSVLRSDPDILRFEAGLSEKLGAKVAIQHNARGSGKLVIQYNSLDELEGIVEHIK